MYIFCTQFFFLLNLYGWSIPSLINNTNVKLQTRQRPDGTIFCVTGNLLRVISFFISYQESLLFLTIIYRIEDLPPKYTCIFIITSNMLFLFMNTITIPFLCFNLYVGLVLLYFYIIYTLFLIIRYAYQKGKEGGDLILKKLVFLVQYENTWCWYGSVLRSV